MTAPKVKAKEYGWGTEWWDEFLLYSPEQGYAWLVRENGHYTLLRPTKIRPSRDPFRAGQKTTIKLGEERFQVYDTGDAVLDEAEGELTWIAKPGDTVKAVDCITPPRIFTVEKSGQELEYFVGSYVDPQEVYEAFGLKETPPAPSGIYACQPFISSPSLEQCKRWSVAFAAAFLGLFLHAMLFPGGTHIFSQDLTSSSEPQGMVTTEPFTITRPDTICRVDVDAPVSNSWLWLGFDVLDETGLDVGEFSTQVDYYYGSDSEGSWTEGGTHDSALIKIADPGTYRLRVAAEGGSGEVSDQVSMPFSVRIRADYKPLRYYLIAFLLTAGLAVLLFSKKAMFECRRWSPVLEDDDDDD
ncbi:MAG: DUF4178 domain-containing protein [Elusimicrobiota bacterium]